MNSVQFQTPDLDELKKEYFIADMHHHTKYSHDSNTSVAHVIDQAENLGIHVAITDHNAIGGVLNAFESERGRQWVIPGIEVATKEKKDVLIYFYDVKDLVTYYNKHVKPHLKKRSSIRLSTSTYPIADLLEDTAHVHCLVVLPHPVCARIKSTFHHFKADRRKHLLEYVHAIEVINEKMTHRNNLTALGWATALGKPMTAGSDGHRPDNVGAAVTAAKAKTKEEFLDAIKEGVAIVRGTELKMNQRVTAAYYLVAEKAKTRKNKKIDGEYA